MKKNSKLVKTSLFRWSHFETFTSDSSVIYRRLCGFAVPFFLWSFFRFGRIYLPFFLRVFATSYFDILAAVSKLCISRVRADRKKISDVLTTVRIMSVGLKTMRMKKKRIANIATIIQCKCAVKIKMYRFLPTRRFFPIGIGFYYGDGVNHVWTILKIF